MQTFHHPALAYFAIALLAAACSDTDQQTPAKTTEIETAAPAAPVLRETESLVARPLDLTIKPEMLEDIELDQAADTSEYAPNMLTGRNGKHKRLSVGGKLLLDEKQVDSIDAVEGAELNIEIKFD